MLREWWMVTVGLAPPVGNGGVKPPYGWRVDRVIGIAALTFVAACGRSPAGGSSPTPPPTIASQTTSAASAPYAPDSTTAAPPTTSAIESLECRLWSRPQVTQGPTEGPVVTFAGSEAEGDADVEGFHWRGIWSDDGSNGPSLSIAITAGSDSSRPIASYLYQFNAAQPPPTWVGGQGFTGLMYVYHPDNGAELQFWCEVA